MKYKFLFLILLIVAPLFAQNKNQSIGFKENKGQIIDQKGKPNPAVKYLLNSKGFNVQLKRNGFSYDIYETEKHPLSDKQKEKLNPSPLSKNGKDKFPDYTLKYIYHRIDIDFVNSNPKVELIKEEESKDYDNYYNVPNKPDGVLMVHQYRQITYKNIYPNIDVVFSIPKDSLKAVEYNFVVHPNGKISDIQLKFNGTKTELVDNKIRIQVRFGEMEETLPMSWTEDGKSKKEIAVGYKKIKNNIYGFESTENVSNKTMIIDPVPVRLWGTFYGGERWEKTYSIDRDSLNNIYISGETWSLTNLASSGANQITFGSALYYGTFVLDGYIAKFDTNGNRLWSTYYGGLLGDYIKEVKVSKNNDFVIFCGNTSSSNNISTPNSFKPNKSGSYSEMFLGELNANGVRQWATYYGNDNGLTFANSISIDLQNNIYLSGATTSDAFIATPNSFKESMIDNNRFDGFLAKFDSLGNRIWGTYYGGTSDDIIEDSDIDENGNIVLVGYTMNSTDIATLNSYQPNYNTPINSASDGDGMIIKFSPSGNRIWGTYFGGPNSDWIYNCKITGNSLYFSGESESDNLSTPNSFEPIMWTTNVRSSYFAKFNLDTQNKIWFSYSKGKITSIYANNNDEIFIAGESPPTSWNIASPNAFNPVSTYFNSFVIKLNNQCQKIWGTFLGTGAFIFEPKIIADDTDILFVSGTISSNSNTENYGISTLNSFQEFTKGDYESYIVKFKDCVSTISTTSNSPICIGNTLNLKASGGTNYAWTGPNGFTSTNQNPTITNAKVVNSGLYSCAITGTGGCDDTKTVDVIVGDIQAPVPNIVTLPTITGDCNTIITTIPTATDACAGTITATTASLLSYNLPGTYTVVWKYNDGNGNTSNQNQTVVISDQPLPTTASSQTFCIQQNATINNVTITGQNIKWYDALTNGNLLANTTLLQNGTTYYASQTINGCESLRMPILINIQNTLAPTGNSPQSFCTSQNPTLNTIAVAGTIIKWYDSSISGNLLPISTPLQDGKTYYATQTENGCESPTRLPISVSLISTLPANNYEELFCDDSNDGTEMVNLTNYDSNIISNTTEYSFTYYNSLSGAENESVGNKISNFANYKLVLGDNKIYVRINSNTPCYAIVELKLTLLSKPIITIQDIVPLCENKSIAVDAGSGFNSYLWSNGATTQSIIVTNPGDYSVTVANNYETISCSSTKNFIVKKSNIATITSLETQDWTDNQNMITVYVTGNGDYEYSIDGYNYQTSNQFTGLISGKYTVLVRDKNGCGTATDEVYLLMFPKFFTPNGDGYNDTWKIKFSDIEVGLTVKIFDRYGKFIKELDTNTASWNGTYNGNKLPATDYWFVVTRANGKEYKGHFSLKR